MFLFDTFGDEQFWTDALHLYDVVEKHVDPTTALKISLKVDADALPFGILKTVDLKSPATTVALLKLNGIVGLQGTVDTNNQLVRLGATCALCHSTVDNSVMPGIGHRKDGWPNRDLDVGTIIALSSVLTADQKKVYSSWGRGKYDPRYNIDGKNTLLVIPPAYGLAQTRNETYTAEGPISYWNANVAVTQMHAHGKFADKRLGTDVNQKPDWVTSRLPALRAYHLSLNAPAALARSFDPAAADRGHALFDHTCSSCRTSTTGTDNNNGKLHAASDTGMDSACALRTANKACRTKPLRGLWQPPSLLPRWQRSEPLGRSGALQHGSFAGSDGYSAARPGGVPKIASTGVKPCDAARARRVEWATVSKVADVLRRRIERSAPDLGQRQ